MQQLNEEQTGKSDVLDISVFLVNRIHTLHFDFTWINRQKKRQKASVDRWTDGRTRANDSCRH